MTIPFVRFRLLIAETEHSPQERDRDALKRVQIKNFRNFADLDVRLGANAVIIGQNRVGKSNFIFALRLLLDPSLPDSARKLKLSDIWDGYPPRPKDGEAPYIEPQIEVHVDFTGFDDDDALTTLLTDFRLAEDHTTSGYLGHE